MRHRLPEMLAAHFGATYRDEVSDSDWRRLNCFLDIPSDKLLTLVTCKHIFGMECELKERMHYEP